MLQIRSVLSYDKSSYRRGSKNYLCRLVKKDKNSKFEFERMFLDRFTNYINNGNEVSISYKWNIYRDGIYQKFEFDSLRTIDVYFVVKDEEIIKYIDKKEVIKLLNEEE